MEKQFEKNKGHPETTTVVFDIGKNLLGIFLRLLDKNTKVVEGLEEQIKIMSEAVENLRENQEEMQVELDALQARVTVADARDEAARAQLQAMITALEARVAELEGDDAEIEEITTGLQATIDDAKAFLAEEEPPA